MVNYVLSFCKITGASRIFKRNFYLPLLKPLTPKEALRTLRITGKWLLGAKIQHYIPVLLNHKQKRSKHAKNFAKNPHNEMEDFTYMTPVLDQDNENHKLLLKLLESYENSGESVFVYTVEDKKYNIILQSRYELAIQNGDIIDILVSQKNDKIIVKLKNLKKIPMEIQYFDDPAKQMFCGEGTTSPSEEKFHHHGKYTMSLAKVFEDKEMTEEKWEEELKKIMKRRKKQKGEGSKAWKEMMKTTIKNLDWKKFEEDAKKVIEEIEEPATEELIAMEVDDLDATKNVSETLMNGGAELMDQLPTIKEITDVIKNLKDASLTSENSLSGVKVKLTSGKECFISGQMVHTEDGDVFVPGQTVENEYGAEYAPGITINIDNKPTLISGLIMGEEQRDPMFLPTQTTITSDGQLTFATTPEERPAPQPEHLRKLKPKKDVIEEANNIEEEFVLISLEDEEDESSTEDLMEEEPISEKSSVELNNSELEELDIEAIRLKQEQQKFEIEKLKQILLNDGMDDLIASLEEKKRKLKEKLDELRKLSINSENSLITYINDQDAFEMASKITQNKSAINRISDILLTMTRRLATLRDRNNIRPDNINIVNITLSNPTEFDLKFNSCSTNLKILLKSTVVSANEVFKTRPKDQMLAMQSIGEILSEPLQKNSKLLDELMDLMKTSNDRSEISMAICKQLSQNVLETKATHLANLANKTLPPSDVFESITKILERNTLMSNSFIKIAKVDPEVVRILIQNLNKLKLKSSDDEEAVEVLEQSIASSIEELIQKNLYIVIGGEEGNLMELIQEALSFAQALDNDEVVASLTDAKNLDNLKFCTKSTEDMLKRMTLIRQLAERDYSLKTAITRIKKNPQCAKSDPRIRQLIRESASLLGSSNKLKNSRQIPIQLMKKQNLLAIEDFLMQRIKTDLPILISRNALEAVVPKEASRGVLAGRVAYILIDESGVNNFKPMHMRAAINVNQNRERRIDDYLSANSNRDHLHQAKTNGSDGSGSQSRTMSSAPLFRGFTGPRA